MAKVSISLTRQHPKIVVEAEEAELLRDVVGMALRESPRVQSLNQFQRYRGKR